MGCAFEHLFTVQDANFARENHPLAGVECSRADVANFPRLDVAPFVNRHLGLIDRIAFDQMEIERRNLQSGVCTTNSMTAGIDMLQDTDAILVYPIVCQTFFQRHGVTMLDVADRPRTLIEIGVYRLAEKELDEHLNNILDQIRSAAQTIFASNATPPHHP
jgi:DNA-binding transcriptional LysR family regulator